MFLEKQREQKLKSDLERLVQLTEKVLKTTAWNPVLRKGRYSISSKQLKDHEIRSLSLACFLLQDTKFAWELRLFLLEKAHVNDPLSTLLLKSRNIDEALFRLERINPNILSNLKRSYKQSLESGLRKLRVVTPSDKVNYPIRKRGYNDKGSIDPDSAWKNSRAFYVDTEKQLSRYKNQQALQDLEDLLRGLSD